MNKTDELDSVREIADTLERVRGRLDGIVEGMQAFEITALPDDPAVREALNRKNWLLIVLEEALAGQAEVVQHQVERLYALDQTEVEEVA